MKMIKKLSVAMMICAAALAFAACGSSSETEAASDEMEISAAVIGDILSQTTQAEGLLETDSTYSIPADAPTGVNGGPGMMETQEATINPNYPEDKQQGEAAQEGTMICLYAAANYGIYQLFDTVDVCDADSLIAAMINNDVVEADTEVEAFSNEGGDAVLKLNTLKAGYDSASEEQIVTCICNTFIENLGLNSIELEVGGESYGQRTFVDDYAAIK